MALAQGRAVIVNDGDGPPDQRFRQLLGIGDGGAAQDEPGMAAVEFAQAHKPAEHVSQVAAKDPAIGMDFIDDDVLQVFKQLDPLGVMGQNAAVEHIGIGDHHMARLPDGPPGRRRGVAVVGEGFDIHAQQLNDLVELAHLIGGQGLGGEKIESTGVGVLQYGREHRQIVAHGLAAGRGRDHHDVLAPGRRLDGLGLMGIQPLHAPLAQHGRQLLVHAGRPIRVPGGARRIGMPMGDALHELGILPEHA